MISYLAKYLVEFRSWDLDPPGRADIYIYIYTYIPDVYDLDRSGQIDIFLICII